MKTKWTNVALSNLLVVGLAGISQAGVRVWLSVRPFPLVVARPAPVVVAQPAVVPDPYAAPPMDYNKVLVNFHARVQRLQRMLDKQLRRGVINQRMYDRHADDLDAILRDEQRDAALHNGALTPREVHDLNERLTMLQDRVHEDMIR